MNPVQFKWIDDSVFAIVVHFKKSLPKGNQFLVNCWEFIINLDLRNQNQQKNLWVKLLLFLLVFYQIMLDSIIAVEIIGQ